MKILPRIEPGGTPTFKKHRITCSKQIKINFTIICSPDNLLIISEMFGGSVMNN